LAGVTPNGRRTARPAIARAAGQSPVWPARDVAARGLPVLSGTDRGRAEELINLTAARLADPSHVAEAVSANAAGEPGPRRPGGDVLGHCLSETAILYAELGRMDQRWLPVCDRHIRMAAKLAAGSGSAPVALLFAAQGRPGRYEELRRRLAGGLACRQHQRLAFFRSRPGPGVSWQEYDMVNGLSRTLRALLDALDDPLQASASVESAVTATLRHFVRISQPIEVDGHEIPGWWVPRSRQPGRLERQRFLRGNFNLGLAHGVAGPLALISLALQRGHEVSGQRDSIRRFADWLAGWVLHDENGCYWPCWVEWTAQVAAERSADGVTRTAWCYGAPGVAYALYQAGTALGVARWERVALAGLRATLDRDESSWHLDGPTVCHGYAGLLQVLWRMGVASGETFVAENCSRVARQLLRFGSPSRRFVFAHLTPDPPWPGPVLTYRTSDLTGIRTGAAGVACALLSVTLQQPTAGRAWDRCLALS
jgi:lantibiotic biosynthesis protein